MSTFMTRSLWLGAAMLAASSLPAFADATVNVDLTGEAGDKMGMKLDHDTVPAGKITFIVKNDAMATDHEMVVVRLKHKNDEIPMIKGKHRVDEDKLKSMGEVEGLEPGKTGEMSADLKAGDYLLLCNLKGHFEAGMTSHFTVTK